MHSQHLQSQPPGLKHHISAAQASEMHSSVHCPITVRICTLLPSFWQTAVLALWSPAYMISAALRPLRRCPSADFPAFSPCSVPGASMGSLAASSSLHAYMLTCRGFSLILTVLWWRLQASSAIWCFPATAFPGCLFSVACSCSGLPLTWAWLLAAGPGTMVGFADLVFSQLSGGLLASRFDWLGQGHPLTPLLPFEG